MFLEANINAAVVWKRLKALLSTTRKHKVHEILNKDNMVNGVDPANSFNEHFVNLVPPEHEGHACNTVLLSGQATVKESLLFFPRIQLEILSAIMNLKNVVRPLTLTI